MDFTGLLGKETMNILLDMKLQAQVRAEKLQAFIRTSKSLELTYDFIVVLCVDVDL